MRVCGNVHFSEISGNPLLVRKKSLQDEKMEGFFQPIKKQGGHHFEMG